MADPIHFRKEVAKLNLQEFTQITDTIGNYPFMKRSGPIETPMRPGRGLTRDRWKTTSIDTKNQFPWET
jgi:hypothetical protein